ncbi:dTDP-4-dehydrorhamnose 3,5-epimerase [Paenibacillus aceris]|uniref:dTDP-4-dehydrorhamnose 3,5-epimerase n=1 Tax=Paenibacillus aceris TaxID=869555 RepID=A0ABS4I7U6_9BACL|nr:dTDP-4-dehydrorhamnose 3,5-epimerase [Paenibacillus aceris]MBP1966987.1 dTDP-4-dehydrorhamnose 3,5-epimerase [Paenibacillus aceris]NHW39350.1 dTDP-4-dehydrorhamnose 3,5-epimerase [Paenibacillus aceris]
MKVVSTKLPGVLLLEPKAHGDHRGFFMESYNREQLAQLGIHCEFVQDNHSLSVEAGILRGLHYQLAPKAQTKLVRVLSGAVYDVVVDIRKSSPTYGEWIGVILSAENKRQILVPQGFAHGVCTLVPHTQLMYKVDQYYSPEHDRGIQWNDPQLAIDWPMSDPILSAKDRQHPPLQQADNNFN